MRRPSETPRVEPSARVKRTADHMGGSTSEGLDEMPEGIEHREVPRGHSLPDDIATLPSAGRRDDLRIVEARLFASSEPLAEEELASAISSEADVRALLDELAAFYAGRGINLVRVARKWAFRTAPDLAFVLEKHTVEERRLSKAAMETLAIIAYHQPATRAEIEEIRGVTISKGTLDLLMEIGWIRPRGRRRAPGKPLTYGTTESFLSHFGLETITDLPGLAELKGAGLLDATLPPDFRVPNPKELATLLPDELPIEAELDDIGVQETFDYEDPDAEYQGLREDDAVLPEASGEDDAEADIPLANPAKISTADIDDEVK
jgi:segregation and condensation protein B